MRHRKEENSSRAALQVIGVVILFANPPASLSCYMSYSPNAFRSENVLGNNKYEGALQVAVQACGISGKERGKPVDCTHTWPMLDPQAPRRLTDMMETAYQMPCREETLSNYLWKE